LNFEYGESLVFTRFTTSFYKILYSNHCLFENLIDLKKQELEFQMFCKSNKINSLGVIFLQPTKVSCYERSRNKINCFGFFFIEIGFSFFPKINSYLVG